MTALQRAAVVTQIAYVGINSDIHSIRLFSLAKHTILALIVTSQPPLPCLHFPMERLHTQMRNGLYART